MRFADVIAVALSQIRQNKLRSFFTLVGIIVSVAFLVAVVAIISGMNAYVSENLASAVVGANTFQVRRDPIQIGLFDDEAWLQIRKRPRISKADAEAVAAAIPDADAVAITSGYPTPQTDVTWRDHTLGGVLVFGVTPPYQIVQGYKFTSGRGLTEVDVAERRPVAVIGADVAEKLFEGVDPVGREMRVRGMTVTVVGAVAKKGSVLGQSFDGFVMLPLPAFESLYGRRLTTTISVKMPSADRVTDGIARAQEAVRIAHRLRPTEPDNFQIETADALVAFWRDLTRVLFSVIPAVVAIGIIVGGIVIMNIMLMSVQERTREIGIMKSVGATAQDISNQFLAEAVTLAGAGGAAGVILGWTFAFLVAAVSPLPARVTLWSVFLAIGLGATVGVIFGVYPARRAARLDPITALRAE